MSEEPENLLLRYLRRIDARLENVERKLDELVTRVSSLERGFAGFQTDLAAINLRLDNLDRRVETLIRVDDEAARLRLAALLDLAMRANEGVWTLGPGGSG